MIKTKPIGIRLPIELWELVKAIEPNKTYSQIVKGALESKYCIHDRVAKEVDEFLNLRGE